MAELSVEESRRLARNFLIGKGGEAELEDTKRAMDTDAQLALEFLQQMQTALDDAAPAGFSPEQWKEVDTRVAAVIAPLAKSGIGLGFIGKLFSKLFKKKSAPAAEARIKRKGGPAPEEAKPKAAPSESPTSLLTPEAVVEPPSAAPVEGFEEMAPIMAAAAIPTLPPLGAAAAVPPEPPAAAPSEQPPREAAADAAAGGQKTKGSRKILWVALGVIAISLLAWAAWMGAQALRNRKPAPLPVPTPMPTPVPKPTLYSGPPRRSQPPTTQDEPLPSELPPMTPQAAGHIEPQPGLDAKDSQGRKGLPLP